MDYQISQRAFRMLEKDRLGNPQAVCKVLEEEIRPIVENYISLSKEFVVRFKKEGVKNLFFIEIQAERIKPFGYISK